MTKVISENTLFYGDNLDILCDYLIDECVDLIYLDPPFNSSRNYNVLFKDEHGLDSEAQIVAFEDTWHWTVETEHAYYHLITHGPDKVSNLITSLRGIVGTNQMMAYLTMMTSRLVELYRVLKPTGSLYLHCDPTASHYLKIILDTIFGPERFLNEIVWKRTTAHNDPKRYGRIQDRLLFYSKSANKIFNHTPGDYSPEQLNRYKYKDERGPFLAENLTAPHYSPTRTIEWRGTHPGADRQWRFSVEDLETLYSKGRILLQRDGRPRKDGYKMYLDEADGPALQDLWTDIGIGPTSGERLGYPTQKPLALLERIIQTSSNSGDVVLDPFCGCGTAIAAAQKLDRKWIGIDITHLSIALQKYRLESMYPGITFNVIGEPEDIGSAQKLAQDDRYQFQWWALSLIRAKPLGGQVGSKVGKKGSDKGIDGIINFSDDATGKSKRVIVQVKSGHVKSGDIRDLVGTVHRESAAIGVFITLEPPTKDMKTEAVSAGLYYSVGWGQYYPCIQILSIAELLQNAEVKMPPQHGTFKSAQRVQKRETELQQATFDLEESLEEI